MMDDGLREFRRRIPPPKRRGWFPPMLIRLEPDNRTSEQRERERRAGSTMLDTLRNAGLTVEEGSGRSPATVDGRFLVWPSTGTWRAIDGNARGYGARSLIAVARVGRG